MGRFAGMVLLLSIIIPYSNASPADNDLPDRTATPRASPPEDEANILQVKSAVCFDNPNLSQDHESGSGECAPSVHEFVVAYLVAKGCFWLFKMSFCPI
jgi:hypothetical protein